MNSIIEDKIKNFKLGEGYKVATEPGKKTYTIFNEELKEIFWELFSQMVRINVERVAKNGSKKESENEEYFAPVVSIGGKGEEGGLIFSVGETAAEKAQREKKFKEEMEATIKRSEEIARKHEEIERRSREIEKRCEEIDKIGNNSEKEKQFEQWDKAGRKCHICGKEAGSLTVSFTDKQGKWIITCSLECWKKGMKDNGDSVNQIQQARIASMEKSSLAPQTKQNSQSSSSNSSANKPTIFWIIGGIAILSIIGAVIYLFNQKRK